MAYEAKRNSQSAEDESVASQIRQQKADKKVQDRENTKALAKDAGSIAMQAHGVPAPVAEKAVDTVEKAPGVEKALNKISDTLHKNPAVSKAINKVAESPLRDVAKNAIAAKVGSGGNNPSSPQPANAQTTKKVLDTTKTASNVKTDPKQTGSTTSNKNNTDKGQKGKKKDSKSTENKAEAEGSKSSKKPNWLLIIVIGSFVSFLFIVVFLNAILSQFFPMFGTDTATGLGFSDANYVVRDPNSPEGKFYINLNKVKQEYKSAGKDFNAQVITAVYFIMNRYEPNFTFVSMDESTIRELADLMFTDKVIKVCENGENSVTVEGEDTTCPEGYTENVDKKVTQWSKDEEAFKTKLKTQFIKKKLPDINDAKLDGIVEEIYTYIDNYNDLIQGNKGNTDYGGLCYVNGNTQASVFDNKSPKEVLEIIGPIAQEDYSRTGVLASVTLAQFIIESGWGKSDMGVNNMFGIKCDGNWTGDCKEVQTAEEYIPGQTTIIKAQFKVYSSVEASFADHTALLMLPRYDGITSAKTPREQLEIIKKGGYATASNYVEALLDVINDFDLQKWDVVVDTTSKPLSCLTSWTVRTVAPTASDTAFMYVNSNRGQCVWYAQGRAIEIVEALGKKGSFSSEQVDKIRSNLLRGYGNAEGWYPNTRGVFKGSTNVEDVKVGSIIVWGGGSKACTPACGHVAIVEDINVAKNTITITDGWSTSGGYGSCPNDFSCVTFRNRTMSLEDYFRGVKNDFGASGGTQFFKGYVYFLEPES